MTIRRWAAVAALLVVSSAAIAQEASVSSQRVEKAADTVAPTDGGDQEGPVPEMILAHIAKNTYGGKTADDCSNGYDKRLEADSIVLIIGVKDCEPRYGTPKRMFEVAYHGDTYFVARDDVRLDAEYQAKLDAVTPEMWPETRKFNQVVELSSWQDRLDKALADFRSKSAQGLAIADWSVVDESEYTDGTGLKIAVHNPTKKTIKYIWFTVSGLNEVDDPVGGPHTVRAIGPIKPDEGGEYRYEYVWMTDIVESARIRQIKVQYMDGSVKVIAQPGKAMLDDTTIAVLESD